MLGPGEYKVIATLNISHSLLNLSRDPAHKPGDLHKVLLQAQGANHVSYFVDSVDFGAMSVIRLTKATEALVRKADYAVAERVEPAGNKAFVKKLLEKVRAKS